MRAKLFIAIRERNTWEGETWTRYIPQTEKNMAFAKRFDELIEKYQVNGMSVTFNSKGHASHVCVGYMLSHAIVEKEFDADSLPDANDPWKPGSCSASKFEDYIYKMKWADHGTDLPTEEQP